MGSVSKWACQICCWALPRLCSGSKVSVFIFFSMLASAQCWLDLLAHMLSSTLSLHDKNNIGNKVSFFCFFSSLFIIIKFFFCWLDVVDKQKKCSSLYFICFGRNMFPGESDLFSAIWLAWKSVIFHVDVVVGVMEVEAQRNGNLWGHQRIRSRKHFPPLLGYFLLTLENFICCHRFSDILNTRKCREHFFGKFFHWNKRSVKSLIFYGWPKIKFLYVSLVCDIWEHVFMCVNC